MTKEELDQLCINTIRFLAVDAVQKANSGHPGLPLGAAPMAYVLWSRFLRHDPADPGWRDRDRFVLSAGHGSALLYAAAAPDRLRPPARRAQALPAVGQPHARPSRERTSRRASRRRPVRSARASPTRSGMAIAEAHLAARYNRPGHAIFDHFTYVLASDGDLMEGVRAEAASLAGHLRLGQADRPLRRQPRHAVGHHAASPSPRTWRRATAPTAGTSQHVADGNDVARDRARAARRDEDDGAAVADHRRDRHRLRRARTRAGRSRRTASPLGADEVPQDQAEPRLAGRAGVLRPARRAGALPRRARARRGTAAEWRKRVRRLRARVPRARGRARAALRAASCPARLGRDLPVFAADAKGMATRKASEAVLQALARDGARAGRRLGRSRSVDVHLARRRTATSSAARGRRRRAGRRRAAAGATRAATSTSACASTRWAPR